MPHDVAITDLSARVVEAARASRDKIITVESCTAGALCTLLADTPGAGDVLLGGMVTYHETCKAELLRIPSHLIASCSAVSSEVALAMTAGALERCTSATIAIAITCVGGPKPDDAGNPVGLTYIAVGRRHGAAEVRMFQIDEQTSGRVRGEVLSQACYLLLQSLTAPKK